MGDFFTALRRYATAMPASLTPAQKRVFAYARGLMDEHGLQHIPLRASRAVRAAGSARERRGEVEIALSVHYAGTASLEEMRDVILHEIAHVLAGISHGHDATWREVAQRIGANPRATHRMAAPVEPKWRGVCPNGHEVFRMRKTRAMSQHSCAKCARTYDPRYRFRWEQLR